MNRQVLRLEGFRFPPCINLREANSLNPLILPPNFKELFDTSTFFYDAISTKNAAILVCPKLLNLELIVRSCKYWLDDRQVIPIVRRQPRFDILVLRGSSPKELRIGHSLFDFEVTLSKPSYEYFSGLNTLITVNRNNELQWIVDWIHYHKFHHALQALLIFDNHSDIYSSSELAEAIRQTGLKTYLIVEAHFPFGPVLRNRSQHLLFLQDSLFHIARLRFIHHARAVLSIDIDEIVEPCPPGIFTRAVKSPTGIIRFGGLWRYAKPREFPPVRHGDHRYSRTRQEHCPPKLAYVPKRLPWILTTNEHGLNISSPFARKCVHAVIRQGGSTFWHCYDLSTGWKGARTHAFDDLHEDPDLSSALNQAGLKESKQTHSVEIPTPPAAFPNISIIIPARNRSDLLVRAIQSVRRQELVSVEIVVVDDGSSPPLSELLPPHIKSSVKLLRLDKGRNAAYSRNFGAASTSTPFLAFLDSDDQWGPFHLHDALQRLGGHQALFVAPFASASHGRDVVADPYHYLFSGEGDLRTSCFVMPREVFEAVGGFDENLAKHQDWDLAFRIAERFPLMLGSQPNALLDQQAPGRMSTRVNLPASKRFLVRHGPRFTRRQRQIFLRGLVRTCLRQSDPAAWRACRQWMIDNQEWHRLTRLDRAAMRIPSLVHQLLSLKS